MINTNTTLNKGSNLTNKIMITICILLAARYLYWVNVTDPSITPIVFSIIALLFLFFPKQIISLLVKDSFNNSDDKQKKD